MSSGRVARAQRTSKDAPCPVCGKPDWCIFSSDGRFICCQRCESWGSVRAIRRTNAGWLFPLDDGQERLTLRPELGAPAPLPPRPVLDQVYRALAELLGVREEARHDLVTTRQFPAAFQGDALYFSLPRSRSENERVSEELIERFGLDVIQRVPGFTSLCRECDGRGTMDQRPCQPCDGLGRRRPRFRSVRAGRHDYALIACDQAGLAWWGLSRRLPFDRSRQDSKYLLLSSGRAGEPSLSGLPKYHIAGRQFPATEVVFTEGLIKAEITAWKLQHRVVGLYSTSIDEPTKQELVRLLQEWDADRALIAFDMDKYEPKHENVLHGERTLIRAFTPFTRVATAEWSLATAKGIDDLLVLGGSFRRVDQIPQPVLRPRVPCPCATPGEVDGGFSLAEVEAMTRERIRRRFSPAYRNTVGLIGPPAGCRKTGSVLAEQEVADIDVLWAVARHGQGDELVGRASEEPCRCGVARGTCPEHRFTLNHDWGRNEENCANFELIELATKTGYGRAINEAICGTVKDPICHFRPGCAYHQQFARGGSHVAAMETVLKRPTGVAETKAVVFDDPDSSRLVIQVRITDEMIERALSTPRAETLRPLLVLLQHARQQATKAGVYHQDAYRLLDDVARQQLGTTLEHLLSNLPAAALLIPAPEVEAYRAAPPGQLIDLLALLHEELPRYLSGKPFTAGLRLHAGGVDIARLNLPTPDRGGRTAFSGKSLAVLTATPDPILRQWLWHLDGEPTLDFIPKVALPAELRVIQDVGAFYGKGTVVGSRNENLALFRKARAYLDELHPQRPAIITHKDLCDRASEILGVPRERVLHFGNQRGSNAIRDADLLLVIGTPGMSPDDAYWLACGAYRGEAAPPSQQRVMKSRPYGGWRDRVGRGRQVEVLTFADERVAEIYETSRRDELTQAIFRIRPFDLGKPADWRGTATVVLLTEFPVAGLRVDDLRFSGNAATYENTATRLSEAAELLRSEGRNVTSRALAGETGVTIGRAQAHLREVSAVRSPSSIRRDLIEGGDQAAETPTLRAPPLPAPIRAGCTCPPCPANRGGSCDCGLFWFEPPTGLNRRPHCGRHDPEPAKVAP